MTKNARRSALFISMGLGLAAMFAPAAMPHTMHNRVLVVYNPSDSVPRGWYRIEPVGSLHASRCRGTQLTCVQHMSRTEHRNDA